MNNKKTLIISSIIIVVVILFVVFYPKGQPDTEPTSNSNINLAELDFNYNNDAFKPQPSGEQESKKNLTEIKDPDFIDFIPLYPNSDKWSWQSRMYFAISEWKEKCMTGDLNVGFKYGTDEYCSNLDIFQTSQKDMGILNVKIKKAPDSYYGIESVFYLENNGKKINLSDATGSAFSPSEFAVHPSGFVLVNYHDQESPDGSLPYAYYYNGEKWLSVEEVTKLCVSEKYNRLGFGEDLGGFLFEAKLYKNELRLTEQVYFFESAYNDIFNLARVFYITGPFTFKCNLSDMSFDSVSHPNKGYWVSDEYGIPSNVITPEYKAQFLDFLNLIRDSETEVFVKEYLSWPFNANNVSFKEKSIRLPLNWNIEQTTREGFNGIEKVYSVKKGSEFIIEFSDRNDTDNLIFYNWNSEYFTQSSNSTILSVEDLKVLYILYINLSNQ